MFHSVVLRKVPPVKPILQLSNLSISAVQDKGRTVNNLVQGVNLSIYPGEMVGLIGESGSGKSVTAAAVLGLLPKSLHVTEGHIYLNQTKLCVLSQKERRRYRGKVISYMFQNYQGSFTPFLTVGKQLVESIRCHEQHSVQAAKEIALTWLDRVQLPAARIFASYPFQLSGGQLQRASLAAALMLRPSLLIADEPTTALDVLTGEHVLDLLAALQKESNCAVLLISHDLTHVLKRTDRMAVMYGGRLVEAGTTGEIRRNPQHPYTQLLFRARPMLSAQMPDKLTTIPGEPGSIAGAGCPFALRCPSQMGPCTAMPEMTDVGASHAAACHLLEKEGDVDHAAAARDQASQQVVHI